ncbi:MAG: tRNA pseudouridine(55) synthase TruB [Chloroflexi bacterium]|nr:tRNA pseudouridine(55) synthase TruB [Chloroflexota bacterium]
MDGILPLLKPTGQTSMEAVRIVKRLTRERKVGHAGTLDPAASGVLPICFGQATRVMIFLVDSPKMYKATVRLGTTTDTYDADGSVVSTQDPSGVTREDVLKALEKFRGTILQVPPMYSALKREGRRLYELARAGLEVPREPRKVQVLRLEMTEWAPPQVTLEVECGRGLYLRSLAHDLGQAIGCGGHLARLVRLRNGPFSIEKTISENELEEAVAANRWKELVHNLDSVLTHLKAAIVGPATVREVRQGRQVALGYRTYLPTHGERCRVYDLQGHLVAVSRFDRFTGFWHPDIVFSPAQGK